MSTIIKYYAIEYAEVLTHLQCGKCKQYAGTIGDMDQTLDHIYCTLCGTELYRHPINQSGKYWDDLDEARQAGGLVSRALERYFGWKK